MRDYLLYIIRRAACRATALLARAAHPYLTLKHYTVADFILLNSNTLVIFLYVMVRNVNPAEFNDFKYINSI